MLNALYFALLVVLHRLFEQIWVDLHKELQCIVDHSMYCPIPVGFRVSIQGRENDRKYDGEIVAHQIDDIVVVPVQKRTFSDLEMLAVDAACKLLEEGYLYFLKLYGICDVEYFFDLVEEHDFLW